MQHKGAVMFRQYGTQRYRVVEIGGRRLMVGTIPVGAIYRYQPPRAPRPRAYMVLAWMPRAYASADARRGRTGFCYLARGGHLALVRDLATGREAMMADHLIRSALDEG